MRYVPAACCTRCNNSGLLMVSITFANRSSLSMPRSPSCSMYMNNFSTEWGVFNIFFFIRLFNKKRTFSASAESMSSASSISSTLKVKSLCLQYKVVEKHFYGTGMQVLASWQAQMIIGVTCAHN